MPDANALPTCHNRCYRLFKQAGGVPEKGLSPVVISWRFSPDALRPQPNTLSSPRPTTAVKNVMRKAIAPTSATAPVQRGKELLRSVESAGA